MHKNPNPYLSQQLSMRIVHVCAYRCVQFWYTTSAQNSFDHIPSYPVVTVLPVLVKQ